VYDQTLIAIATLTVLALILPLPAHADGKTSYDTYCASCHGTEGRGDGPIAEALHPRPTNFQDAQYWRGLGPGGDINILRAIKKGGSATDHSTNMPAWEPVLTDDQVNEIIAYLRRLAGAAAFEESAVEPPVVPPAEKPAVPPAEKPALFSRGKGFPII